MTISRIRATSMRVEPHLDPVEAQVGPARHEEDVGLARDEHVALLLGEGEPHLRLVGGEREPHDLADTELDAVADEHLVRAGELLGHAPHVVDGHGHPSTLPRRSDTPSDASDSEGPLAPPLAGSRPDRLPRTDATAYPAPVATSTAPGRAG